MKAFCETKLEDNFKIISSSNSYNIITAISDDIHAHDYAEELSKNNIWARSGNMCADIWFENHKYKPAIRFSIACYNIIN